MDYSQTATFVLNKPSLQAIRLDQLLLFFAIASSLKDNLLQIQPFERAPTVTPPTPAQLSISSAYKNPVAVRREGPDDTTLGHRLRRWNLTSSPHYVTRVHRRILMAPVGSPLSSFRSQREFLYGLIEGLEIHERLAATKSVLHRGLSPNNLIFEGSKSCSDVRPLVFIDFDYAACSDCMTQQYPRRTETLPFVSLSILRQKGNEKNVIHEVADDLESFFYIFIWVCALHTGPNGAVCAPTEEDWTSITYLWGKRAVATGRLTYALGAKSSFIYAPNKTGEEQLTPYFQNLRPLAREWKALVAADDQRRGREKVSDQLPPCPLTHRMIIDLLRRYADTLDPSS